MGNAESALHELAGLHATETNDADGVASAIERFILNDSVIVEAMIQS
jgi:hydroxymethylpyrimidine pyrophosphatase-like HAD family hydrolase